MISSAESAAVDIFNLSPVWHMVWTVAGNLSCKPTTNDSTNRWIDGLSVTWKIKIQDKNKVNNILEYLENLFLQNSFEITSSIMRPYLTLVKV